MGRTTIVQYGDYNNPQTFQLTLSATGPQILGQWWYDFGRIPEANLNLFAGIPCSRVSGGLLTPVFGIFILADGDPAAADLFGVIAPDLIVSAAAVVGFHGYDDTATVVNPGTTRQVLLAVTSVSHGTVSTTPTNYEWRSLLLDSLGA